MNFQFINLIIDNKKDNCLIASSISGTDPKEKGSI